MAARKVLKLLGMGLSPVACQSARA
jgi:hypothetical protein